MSTKTSLILIVLLALVVSACTPKIAKDPAPVSSTNEENNAVIPVTGGNTLEKSNQQEQSANNAPAPAPNVSVNEKQVQRSTCILDGNQPRHIGGCVDFFSPDLTSLNASNSTAPGAHCIPEDDQPRHHSMCGK